MTPWQLAVGRGLGTKPAVQSASKSAVRLLSALALAGAAAFVAPAGAQTTAAAPAQVKTQAPGFYRMMIGQLEITALYDGYVDLSPKLLRNTSAKEVQTLLARMFVSSTPGVQTAVNAYLVHTGTNLILVDAGAGSSCFGPALGRIGENLRAAGYEPAQVDTVLLTHLHGDHACGLVDNGKPLFPNATLHVSQAEADFWLSEAQAQRAPEGARPFYEMARNAVAPYRDANRYRTYRTGDELVPGVVAVDAAGHTPGHTGYLFKSGSDSLLVWGDIVHSHAVQFRRPDVALEFDVDTRQAVRTRKRLFADAARSRLWVAGAHLPFPGIGHVRADAKGYAWVPVEYGPIRTDR
jgi:glyoxylase-like metal-dependent hydrolase (beta-lactamase superfamily II)